MQSTVQPEIESLLSYRQRTDYHITGNWLLASIGNYVFWASLPWILILALGSGVSSIIFDVILIVLGIVGLAVSAASAYLVYLLLNRRNVHFSREQAIFRNILGGLGTRVQHDDANAQASLTNNYRYYVWLAESSVEKSAIFQALLTLTPYLGWFFLTFYLLSLSDDWKEHEIREDYLIQELNRTMGFMGLPFLPTRLRPSQVRHRSGVLLLVLSISTVGIALLVWLHLSIGDPSEHFEFHSHLEFPLASLSAPVGVSGGTAA